MSSHGNGMQMDFTKRRNISCSVQERSVQEKVQDMVGCNGSAEREEDSSSCCRRGAAEKGADRWLSVKKGH